MATSPPGVARAAIAAGEGQGPAVAGAGARVAGPAGQAAGGATPAPAPLLLAAYALPSPPPPPPSLAAKANTTATAAPETAAPETTAPETAPVLDAVSRLLHDPAFHDVEFYCGADGGVVTANRAFLAARNDYFRMLLFGSGMRESHAAAGASPSSQQPPPQMARVSMPEASSRALRRVLLFLHTGELPLEPAAAAGAASDDEQQQQQQQQPSASSAAAAPERCGSSASAAAAAATPPHVPWRVLLETCGLAQQLLLPEVVAPLARRVAGELPPRDAGPALSAALEAGLQPVVGRLWRALPRLLRGGAGAWPGALEAELDAGGPAAAARQSRSSPLTRRNLAPRFSGDAGFSAAAIAFLLESAPASVVAGPDPPPPSAAAGGAGGTGNSGGSSSSSKISSSSSSSSSSKARRQGETRRVGGGGGSLLAGTSAGDGGRSGGGGAGGAAGPFDDLALLLSDLPIRLIGEDGLERTLQRGRQPRRQQEEEEEDDDAPPAAAAPSSAPPRDRDTAGTTAAADHDEDDDEGDEHDGKGPSGRRRHQHQQRQRQQHEGGGDSPLALLDDLCDRARTAEERLLRALVDWAVFELLLPAQQQEDGEGEEDDEAAHPRRRRNRPCLCPSRERVFASLLLRLDWSAIAPRWLERLLRPRSGAGAALLPSSRHRAEVSRAALLCLHGSAAGRLSLAQAAPATTAAAALHANGASAHDADDDDPLAPALPLVRRLARWGGAEVLECAAVPHVTVQSRRPFPLSGRHCFTVSVEQACDLVWLGLSDGTVDPPGWGGKSHGAWLIGSNDALVHGAQSDRSAYATLCGLGKWGDGAVVGVFVDCEAGELFFSLLAGGGAGGGPSSSSAGGGGGGGGGGPGGAELRLGFNSLPTEASMSDDQRRPLYAAASIRAPAQLAFGWRPWSWLQREFEGQGLAEQGEEEEEKMAAGGEEEDEGSEERTRGSCCAPPAF